MMKEIFEIIEDENNKKERLIDSLNTYKSIMDKDLTDYMMSLIELSNPFKDNEELLKNGELLSEFNLYRKILIYNIYNRIMNVFKNSIYASHLIFEKYYNGVRVYYDFEGNKIELYNFSCHERINDFITINLFNSVVDEEKSLTELVKTKEHLNNLKANNNPYIFNNHIIEGPYLKWETQKERFIEYYENKIKKLENKKEFSTLEDLEVFFRNNYYNNCKLEYNLNEEDTDKKVIKKIPEVIIKNNINYL